jgi:hypothetical protein
MTRNNLKYRKAPLETITQRTILALLILSVLLGMITGGLLFLRISYLWSIILILSWLWQLNVSRGLNLRRTIRASRAQVGQVFEEQIDILNTSRFPLFWLEFRDETPLPGTYGGYVLNYIKGKIYGHSYCVRAFINVVFTN